MAGIAGALGKQATHSVVEQMLKTIEHRGPDTVRTCRAGELAAGVCASNLSADRGDGFAQDGNVTVLLDGEIYNDRADGRSDAEVVLGLYKEHGRSFPAYVDGVFACALYDGSDLILARDAVGVRPLYWGRTDHNALCFASELKALVGVAREITEMPPATTFSDSCGVAGYIPRFPEVDVPAAVEDAARQVRETVLAAVRRRLADGAVGACLLSGGLDSSIIAAAAKQLGADLPLITVGMEGAPDLANAKIMAGHLGMAHHVLLYDAEQIRQSVPRAVYTLESFDEDCISGAISNLFASAKAREFTNCILSGEGGDELFGGYHLLKDLPGDTERLRMMERLIAIAHNTALQRLDRAMMGNSINYRTPFIDTKVMALALQVPVQWKIRDSGNGKLVEKWILREAFKELLPEEICSREKLRFSAGTGTDDLMDRLAGENTNGSELSEESRTTSEGYYLNSPKELWYYRLFKERFPDPQFERLVGRWDPGK